jgi:hypothetical protein
VYALLWWWNPKHYPVKWLLLEVTDFRSSLRLVNAITFSCQKAFSFDWYSSEFENMKEICKRKGLKNTETKSLKRTERRENKWHKDNSSKTLTEKGNESKTTSENSETYENLVIHYVDDVNRSEEALVEMKVNEVVDNRSTDLEKEPKEGFEDVSDTDTTKDSVSSQGDSFTNEDEKVEKATKDPKSKVRVNSLENNRGPRERSDRKANKLQSKVSGSNQKKPINSNKTPSRVTNKNTSNNSKTVKVPVKVSSESSEGVEVDEKPVIEVKEIDILDGSSNGAQVKEIDVLDRSSNGTHSVGSEDENRETINAEENGERENAAAVALELKIKEMESRIENLEEELREVAALEVSLYSIVPEHGSSAHKVHTPARRLSRLYIHACKHWTTKTKATIAKNTVSGLILVAKSCGNDVSRYVQKSNIILSCIDFHF